MVRKLVFFGLSALVAFSLSAGPVKAQSSSFNGPLRVSTVNSRYFTDNSGRAVILEGTHTWRNFQAIGSDNFDFTAYLNFLKSNNLNYMRLWEWENFRGAAGYPSTSQVSPMPFVSSGGKYNLTQLNQVYFDRMRQYVVAAGNQGIYVDIQLFNGWSVGVKEGANPWPYHPFNSNNNTNGINGDSNGDGNGYEVHTLTNSAITAIQEAYVKKVVDTVNDLDNVLYEIANETQSGTSFNTWHNHFIDLIHNYEAGKPKQHPVGFTIPYPGGNNADLFSSHADWISPNDGGGYKDNPPASTGAKVITSDTDHLWGLGGDRYWAWKSFTRGIQTSYMDCYVEDSLGCPISRTDPTRVSLLANLGYIRSYGAKMNLIAMTPQNSLASTGYCLAKTGAEYLVYQPSGGSFTVNLVAGNYTVEWLNPANGAKTTAAAVAGGATRSFSPPFSNDAVLYLALASGTPSPTPTTLPTATPTPRPSPSATPTPTSTPTPTACAGDLNGDRVVNLADLSIVLSNWGKTGNGDVNADGIVSLADIAFILSRWGQTCQ